MRDQESIVHVEYTQTTSHRRYVEVCLVTVIERYGAAQIRESGNLIQGFQIDLNGPLYRFKSPMFPPKGYDMESNPHTPGK